MVFLSVDFCSLSHIKSTLINIYKGLKPTSYIPDNSPLFLYSAYIVLTWSFLKQSAYMETGKLWETKLHLLATE